MYSCLMYTRMTYCITFTLYITLDSLYDGHLWSMIWHRVLHTGLWIMHMTLITFIKVLPDVTYLLSAYRRSSLIIWRVNKHHIKQIQNTKYKIQHNTIQFIAVKPGHRSKTRNRLYICNSNEHTTWTCDQLNNSIVRNYLI